MDLLAFSFLIGLVPAVPFLIHYTFFTEWPVHPAGRAIWGLLAVIVLNQMVSLITLLFPDEMDTNLGYGTRVVARFAIAIVLTWLYFLFLRVQYFAVKDRKQKAREDVLAQIARRKEEA